MLLFLCIIYTDALKTQENSNKPKTKCFMHDEGVFRRNGNRYVSNITLITKTGVLVAFFISMLCAISLLPSHASFVTHCSRFVHLDRLWKMVFSRTERVLNIRPARHFSAARKKHRAEPVRASWQGVAKFERFPV